MPRSNYQLEEFQRRPQVFHQTAWDIFTADERDVDPGQKAMDAFRKAGEHHHITLSGLMVEKRPALDYMMDDVRSRVNSWKGRDKKLLTS